MLAAYFLQKVTNSCFYTYPNSQIPNEGHPLRTPRDSIEVDSYQIKGHSDTIYLNAHSIDICETCISVKGYNVLSHGYAKNHDTVYYIQLDEKLRSASSMELSIRYNRKINERINLL